MCLLCSFASAQGRHTFENMGIFIFGDKQQKYGLAIGKRKKLNLKSSFPYAVWSPPTASPSVWYLHFQSCILKEMLNK